MSWHRLTRSAACTRVKRSPPPNPIDHTKNASLKPAHSRRRRGLRRLQRARVRPIDAGRAELPVHEPSAASVRPRQFGEVDGRGPGSSASTDVHEFLHPTISRGAISLSAAPRETSVTNCDKLLSEERKKRIRRCSNTNPSPSNRFQKEKALAMEGFLLYHLQSRPQGSRHQTASCNRQSQAKFFAAKSQLTMFQYASTNFGRALR
ncbi:hypothetical protein OKW46_004270 [Paraburkholderia sp. WSM4179]|nr:hypothetical protein [Paraburkholderia sp. WSM4179]